MQNNIQNTMSVYMLAKKALASACAFLLSSSLAFADEAQTTFGGTYYDIDNPTGLTLNVSIQVLTKKSIAYCFNSNGQKSCLDGGEKRVTGNTNKQFAFAIDGFGEWEFVVVNGQQIDSRFTTQDGNVFHAAFEQGVVLEAIGTQAPLEVKAF